MGQTPLITDPPPIRFTTCPKKEEKNVKCDMWHALHDTWHMTHDMWLVTYWEGGWTFFLNFSSLALTVWDLWYFEDVEEKADWLT